MTTVEVSITGIEDVLAHIDYMRKGLEKPGDELIKALQEEAVDETERRWLANGDGEWAPLKSETTRRKLRKGGTTVALIDTGTMFGSLRADQTAPTEIRLSVPYGGEKRDPNVPRYQQYGTRHIPARPMLKKTARLKGRIIKVMLEYIYKLIAYKEPMR